MKVYRIIFFVLAIIFAAAGLLFLLAPQAVIGFFNSASALLGMREIPRTGTGFYHAVAAAYMYTVTLLAFMIYRKPHDRLPAFILANAKLASAIFSFLLFTISAPYLIFLVNGIIDCAIGIGVLILSRHYARPSGAL